MGSRLGKQSAHVYGYALEQVCNYLGSPLQVNFWDAVHWRTLEVTGMDQVFERGGSPIKLPPIPDFPSIGHIMHDKIPLELARLRNQKSLSADKEFCALIAEADGWLETAFAQNKSLVFFYY